MYRLLELNPQLQPFAGDVDLRMFLYRTTKQRLLGEDQTLLDFANAHNYYGFHHVDGGWYYREWAPSAYQLYLEGDAKQANVNVVNSFFNNLKTINVDSKITKEDLRWQVMEFAVQRNTDDNEYIDTVFGLIRHKNAELPEIGRAHV